MIIKNIFGYINLKLDRRSYKKTANYFYKNILKYIYQNNKYILRLHFTIFGNFSIF